MNQAKEETVSPEEEIDVASRSAADEAVVLAALCTVVTPQLTEDDGEIFRGIIRDVFITALLPNVSLSEVTTEELCTTAKSVRVKSVYHFLIHPSCAWSRQSTP